MENVENQPADDQAPAEESNMTSGPFRHSDFELIASYARQLNGELEDEAEH
ncbi:hypothetical protein [Paenibacillus aestuarii]|uniref:YfhD family protein n=1 Tax=Paenibacillus aestuarii TaxID=516965 RepID=A0ABW0KFX0_9BACL|nr:hypothetical protein [Paenibacillus aestuarii]